MTLFVLWVHVAAVVAWIGGVAFQLVALRPGAGAQPTRALLDGARRARPVTWTAVAAVALTGFYNVTTLGPAAQVIESGAALILAGKFILVIAAIAVASQRDFNQLPRALALLAAGADPTPALRAMAWMDRIVLALAATIIYLGLALSRR